MSETIDAEALARDQAARRCIREDLTTSLLVEASAGTGKTSELVRRLVGVLAAGTTDISGIVAVTFTRQAAGELKLRLRKALDQARQNVVAGDDGRIHLEHAIAHLEEARIGTIHAFCAHLLRERPVEARIDPLFEALTEGEAARLYRRVFRRWLQRHQLHPPEGLARAFRRADEDGPTRSSIIPRLQAAGWKLIEWRDLDAPWTRPAFDREEKAQHLLRQGEKLVQAAADCPHPSWQLIRAWVEKARHPSQAWDSYDLEASLVRLQKQLKRTLRRTQKMQAALISLRDEFFADLSTYSQQADADLAAALQEELRELVQDYQEAKRQAGLLDFCDLLLVVRDLLSSHAEVRQYFQKKITHIFVDEFQDTDPLQAEILILLAASDPSVSNWKDAKPTPGKLFLVGDPKQSIYRFRRADVSLYHAIRERLKAQGVRVLQLLRSFRADQDIQNLINQVFGACMQADQRTGTASYIPLIGGSVQGRPRAQPALVALPPPTPLASYGKADHRAIGACLPKTIAAFVAWLLNESGWKIRDPLHPHQPIAVRPRDIALLFRNYSHFGQDSTQAYVEALEAHKVPHVLVSGRGFYEREEVDSIRVALTAIEWPEDELSVYATLRGALFGISDETLCAFRRTVCPLHPCRLKQDAPTEGADLTSFQAVWSGLDILRSLHQHRNQCPFVQTIHALLEATRAQANLSFRSGGPQALANVQRIGDLARTFEISGGLSFRSFVEQLDREAEGDRGIEAPLLEARAEGVRLMTVHSAKGLEFPVVVLADMHAQLAHTSVDRYVDAGRKLFATKLVDVAPHELWVHSEEERLREQAEGVRIAYVAATRARDLLVLPAVGTGPVESWFSPLNAGIYPLLAHRRTPTEKAFGCPNFGSTSLLQSVAETGVHPENSVHPGLFRLEAPAGSYDVVWWDPGTLRTRVHKKFGLRGEQLLAQAHGGLPGIRRYQAWQAALQKTVMQGGQPTLSPFAPSDPQALPVCGAESVRIDSIYLPRNTLGRPSGARFGTLVHAILRDVALDADTSTITRLAAHHARLIGATPPETDTCVPLVAATLASDLFMRVRRAEPWYRELPIVFPLSNGAVLDGNIDLCFFEQGTWYVVDYKTDLDPSLRKDQYHRQLSWYVFAMSQIMHAPARGIMLVL